MKAKKKKVGFTCGAFDLCHAGHMLVFKEAKTVCDYLIVFLQTDPTLDGPDYRGKVKNKPVMSLEERQIILEGVKYIDEVRVYATEADLYDKLKALRADIRVIGADWKGKKFTGHDLPFDVYYNSRSHNFSTSALRERVYLAELEKRRGKESGTPRKKVFVSGCYDILHAGHVQFFKDARALGDYLIVCFASDEVLKLYKRRPPSIPEDNKAFILSNLSPVDKVVKSSDLDAVFDFASHIEREKPQILAVTEDDGHQEEKRRFCRERGIEFVVLPKRNPATPVSTTSIIESVRGRLPDKASSDRPRPKE